MILGTGEGRVQRASVKGTLLCLGERPWLKPGFSDGGEGTQLNSLWGETGKIYGVDRVDVVGLTHSLPFSTHQNCFCRVACDQQKRCVSQYVVLLGEPGLLNN